MEKIDVNSTILQRYRLKKMLMIMKLCIVLTFGFLFNLNAGVFSQQRINMELGEVGYKEVFNEISKQTGMTFMYSDSGLNKESKVIANFNNVELEEVLKTILKGKELTYLLKDEFIVIMPIEKSKVKFQNKFVVKGKIIDENGNSMPGVTIIIEGTTMGTSSDNKGEFTMNLPIKEGKLIVSFIGYKKQIVKFVDDKYLVIKLEIERSNLDEVTVQAYGTTTRREMTGSISTVKAKELENIPTSNIASILQGKVPGMDITNIGGAPGGGGSQITIRGYNSLDVEEGRHFSNPLWVVDGIPMDSKVSEATGTHMLAHINPEMIESIEVLKDASAAAMYGSRAANGVIIVTTKRGKKNQKASFSANISHTYSVLPKLPTVTIGRKEREYRLKALTNLKQLYYDTENKVYAFPNSPWESFERVASRNNRYDFWFDPYAYRRRPGVEGYELQDSLNSFYNNSTNYFPVYFKKGKILNANLQCFGGTKNLVYGVGLGYYKEEGILRGTGYDRLNISSNLKVDATDKLWADLRFNFTFSERDRSAGSRGAGGTAIETIPGDPYKLSTTFPGEGSAAWEQIINSMIGTDEKNRNLRMLSNFKLGYDFSKYLKFSSNLAIDYSFGRRNTFTPSSLSYEGWSHSRGVLQTEFMLLNENLLTFKKSFNQHNVSAVLGSSYQRDEEEFYTGYGKNSPSDEIFYVDENFADYADIQGTVVTFKDYLSRRKEKYLMSFFGRLEYNYKKKYLFSASLRADGCSVFGENNKWGYFPSFAGAWTFSEEKFMNWADWLDFGKIRTSWGISGKHFDQEYLALGVLQAGKPINGLSTIEPEWGDGYYNKNLSWEETDQLDVGFELDLFNYKINVSFDYYLRNTRGLLFPVTLPGNGSYTSYGRQWQNAADVSNSGIEFMLKYNVLRKKDFTWKVGVNFAKNWNRFDNSYNGKDLKVGFTEMLIIGKELNGIYGYLTDGFYEYQEDIPIVYNMDGASAPFGGSKLSSTNKVMVGDYKRVDVNGDNKLTSADKVYLGSALPKISGGITSELKWNNFDLNFMFAYQLGRNIVNQQFLNSVKTDFSSMHMLQPILGDLENITFWEKPGDNTDFPKIIQDWGAKVNAVIDRKVEKVNWIKLKTFVVGYTLPKKYSNLIGVKSLRTFLTCENLFCIDNYSGIDPESVDIRTGIDLGDSYPLSRKFTVGLNVKF